VRVHRTFAFVDLSGFTRFTDTHGDEEAVAALTCFRSVVRSIGSDFGVRIAKWLGDGAMFVAVDGPPLVAAVLELQERLEAADMPLPIRAGLSSGDVILLEGDDYTGGAVNLAARLCDMAAPFEMLVTEEVAAMAPPGVQVQPVGDWTVAGFGAPVRIARILRASVPDPAAEALASGDVNA
jgi:class 3 adenylate cyclase